MKESEIEDILVANPELCFWPPGIKRDVVVLGRQVVLPRSGRADLLLRADGDPFIVEVKTFADEGAIAQCLRYMGDYWYSFDLYEKRVYGCVVALGASRYARRASVGTQGMVRLTLIRKRGDVFEAVI